MTLEHKYERYWIKFSWVMFYSDVVGVGSSLFRLSTGSCSSIHSRALLVPYLRVGFPFHYRLVKPEFPVQY